MIIYETDAQSFEFFPGREVFIIYTCRPIDWDEVDPNWGLTWEDELEVREVSRKQFFEELMKALEDNA